MFLSKLFQAAAGLEAGSDAEQAISTRDPVYLDLHPLFQQVMVLLRLACQIGPGLPLMIVLKGLVASAAL